MFFPNPLRIIAVTTELYWLTLTVLMTALFWADSTGRRNTSCMARSEKFVESFRWCFPSEGFPGPGVEC
jgi:hypothetical protein